mmetsp:Transcript_9539/g.23778  ORF Transcript_9539/g.23778 Transcript_9539/m.23778 type:complete len:218 (+) Transcript_9539:147-800(+)
MGVLSLSAVSRDELVKSTPCGERLNCLPLELRPGRCCMQPLHTRLCHDLTFEVALERNSLRGVEALGTAVLRGIVLGMHVAMAGQAVSQENRSAGICTLVGGTPVWGPTVEQHDVTRLTNHRCVADRSISLWRDHAAVVERNHPWAPSACGYFQRAIVHCGSIDGHHGRDMLVTAHLQICRRVLVRRESSTARQLVIDLLLEKQGLLSEQLRHHICQ